MAKSTRPLSLLPDVVGTFTDGTVPCFDSSDGKFKPVALAAGGAFGGYTFTQSTPATVWTVNHNLGLFPAVTVVDDAGDVVIGDVDYVDANTVTVTFSGAFSGVAYLR